MAGDRQPTRGGSAKKLLTAEQERTVREAIAGGATQAQAAAAVGVTRRRLCERLRDQLADVRVGQGKRGGRGRAVRDPTPEEIAVACAALRRRWTADRWGIGEADFADTTRHGREIRLR